MKCQSPCCVAPQSPADSPPLGSPFFAPKHHSTAFALIHLSAGRTDRQTPETMQLVEQGLLRRAQSDKDPPRKLTAGLSSLLCDSWARVMLLGWWVISCKDGSKSLQKNKCQHSYTVLSVVLSLCVYQCQFIGVCYMYVLGWWSYKPMCTRHWYLYCSPPRFIYFMCLSILVTFYKGNIGMLSAV